MTYMLDRLNSEDETRRVEELETELDRVRNAFEEYLSTTEGLEVDVNKELHEMRKLVIYITKSCRMLFSAKREKTQMQNSHKKPLY